MEMYVPAKTKSGENENRDFRFRQPHVFTDDLPAFDTGAHAISAWICADFRCTYISAQSDCLGRFRMSTAVYYEYLYGEMHFLILYYGEMHLPILYR